MNDNAKAGLYRYHVWANERVLQHLRDLPADVHRTPIQSVFPTIGDTLAHMYIVDNVWLCAMKGDLDAINSSLPHWQAEVMDADLDRFASCFGHLKERYEEFLDGLPELYAVADYPHPTHGVLRASYGDIIQHVVNHGTYHRGNITAMLRQLGHAGAPTDYVWYRFDVHPQDVRPEESV